MAKQADYLYRVGQYVNVTLRILKRTRDKQGKVYLVQSVIYPNSDPYKIRETNLKRGSGCAYKRGLRVCEESSLWSIEGVRPYIKKEEAINLSKKSGKKILCECLECNLSKKIIVKDLVNRGFSCLCTNGVSYPELFFSAYLEAKKLEYETQVEFNNSLKRIDFYIPSLNVYVETHGVAHYNPNHPWYKKTHKSDLIKINWCIKNKKQLIELDCRKSTFKFIKDSIEQSVLPNIHDSEIKTILNLIRKTKRYDTKKIIKMYKDDKKSVYQIASELGFSHFVVSNVLQKNNVQLHNDTVNTRRMVKCVETDEIFTSIKKASRELGIDSSNISKVLNGKYKTTGGYHFQEVFL